MDWIDWNSKRLFLRSIRLWSKISIPPICEQTFLPIIFLDVILVLKYSVHFTVRHTNFLIFRENIVQFSVNYLVLLGKTWLLNIVSNRYKPNLTYSVLSIIIHYIHVTLTFLKYHLRLNYIQYHVLNGLLSTENFTGCLARLYIVDLLFVLEKRIVQSDYGTMLAKPIKSMYGLSPSIDKSYNGIYCKVSSNQYVRKVTTFLCYGRTWRLCVVPFDLNIFDIAFGLAQKRQKRSNGRGELHWLFFLIINIPSDINTFFYYYTLVFKTHENPVWYDFVPCYLFFFLPIQGQPHGIGLNTTSKA